MITVAYLPSALKKLADWGITLQGEQFRTDVKRNVFQHLFQINNPKITYLHFECLINYPRMWPEILIHEA